MCETGHRQHSCCVRFTKRIRATRSMSPVLRSKFAATA